MKTRIDTSVPQSGRRYSAAAVSGSRPSILRTKVLLAFTLIEILVTIGLLSFIILGLLAMFNQVQRAFTTSMTQSDILETGRAATDLLVRDLEQMTPSQLPYLVSGNQTYRSTNFYAELSVNFCNPPLLQGLPGTTTPAGAQLRRTNIVENFFFLSRQNQDWIGTGYAVIPSQNDYGVGTLYRFSAQISKWNQMWGQLSGQYWATNNPLYLAASIRNAIALAQINASLGLPITNSTVQISRIADGIVHLRVQVFDTNGISITPGLPGFNQYPPTTSFLNNVAYWPWDPNLRASGFDYEQADYYFLSNAVPAGVEIELGVLEPKLLQRYRSFANISTPTIRQQTQLNYLSNYVAQVHLFRQRVAIRNVDPSVYQ
jgi:hypothetical protein